MLLHGKKSLAIARAIRMSGANNNNKNFFATNATLLGPSSNAGTAAAASAAHPPPIHSRKFQSIRQFILDRPKALNALNLEMIHTLVPQLQAWQLSDLCKVVVISNLPGTKAFCAGGDVKSIALGIQSQLPKDIEKQLKFFEEEYKLNHLIATSKKPYVSILNGITMGGGVGLSVHGHFRIATENTMIAMPETSIGLFPDVGGSFFLPRLDGELGTFLGLTGHRLKGEEAFIAGFATHYIPTDRLEPLMERLAELQHDSLEVVNSCIDEYSAHIPTEKFLNWSLGGKIGALIDRTFKFDKIEEILLALDAEGKSEDPEIAAFANKQFNILKSASPTSLKVTLKQLRMGAKMDLASCFQMEYRMVRQFLRTPDFIEGVIGKLVEKREAVWSPSMDKLTTIGDQVVEQFFSSRDGEHGKDLQLYNHQTYFDYPHRTLSGLPTSRDIQRVIAGEGKRGVSSAQPQNKREVLDFMTHNWVNYDKALIGDSSYLTGLPTTVSIEGGCGRGKVGLYEKVEAIVEQKTRETERYGLKWVY